MGEGKLFDPHRRLCPDGACIGVVGTDGRCHVCGRVAGGASAPAGGAPSTDEAEVDDDADAEDGDGDGDEKESPVAVAASAGGGFDPKRRLCPDGGCLGVIGADGVCNVCGKKPE